MSDDKITRITVPLDISGKALQKDKIVIRGQNFDDRPAKAIQRTMTTFNEGAAHGVYELSPDVKLTALTSAVPRKIEASHKLVYKVLTADNATQLAHVVNVAIDDGWCPSGGVAVSLSESDDYKYEVWAQAMVISG